MSDHKLDEFDELNELDACEREIEWLRGPIHTDLLSTSQTGELDALLCLYRRQREQALAALSPEEREDVRSIICGGFMKPPYRLSDHPLAHVCEALRQIALTLPVIKGNIPVNPGGAEEERYTELCNRLLLEKLIADKAKRS